MGYTNKHNQGHQLVHHPHPPILSRVNPSCGIGHPGTVVLSTGPTASDTWAGRMLLCAILTASLHKVKVTEATLQLPLLWLFNQPPTLTYPPPINKALLRDQWLMVNSPLIRPYLLGGGTLGWGRLTSHDTKGNAAFVVPPGNIQPY